MLCIYFFISLYCHAFHFIHCAMKIFESLYLYSHNWFFRKCLICSAPRLNCIAFQINSYQDLKYEFIMKWNHSSDVQHSQIIINFTASSQLPPKLYVKIVVKDTTTNWERNGNYANLASDKSKSAYGNSDYLCGVT